MLLHFKRNPMHYCYIGRKSSGMPKKEVELQEEHDVFAEYVMSPICLMHNACWMVL